LAFFGPISRYISETVQDMDIVTKGDKGKFAGKRSAFDHRAKHATILVGWF